MKIAIDDIAEEDEGSKLLGCTASCLVLVEETAKILAITVHTHMTLMTLTVNADGFVDIQYDSPNIVFNNEKPAERLAANAGF